MSDPSQVFADYLQQVEQKALTLEVELDATQNVLDELNKQNLNLRVQLHKSQSSEVRLSNKLTEASKSIATLSGVGGENADLKERLLETQAEVDRLNAVLVPAEESPVLRNIALHAVKLLTNSINNIVVMSVVKVRSKHQQALLKQSLDVGINVLQVTMQEAVRQYCECTVSEFDEDSLLSAVADFVDSDSTLEWLESSGVLDDYREAFIALTDNIDNIDREHTAISYLPLNMMLNSDLKSVNKDQHIEIFNESLKQSMIELIEFNYLYVGR